MDSLSRIATLQAWQMAALAAGRVLVLETGRPAQSRRTRSRRVPRPRCNGAQWLRDGALTHLLPGSGAIHSPASSGERR
jgi:hypothetical protein